MKYLCQRDYPHWLYLTRTGFDGAEQEKGKTTTVSSSGCGLCAAVMVADQLLPNCEFGLKDALDLSYSLNANHRKGTDYTIFAPVLAEKLGLKLEISRDIADVHRCLRSGGSVVALVQGTREGRVGLFANSGHYINVIGYEPDGRFVILDPSLQPGKYDIPERREKAEVRHGCLVISEERYLAEEGSVQFPPFYLFWRT